MPVTVEIDGVGRVELGDEFKAMAPEQQQKTIEEIVASVRRGNAPDVGQAESFARGTADMLSFGTADEITAGLSSGLGLWGDYDKDLTETRNAYKAAQDANPMTYLGGQVAGGILPAIVSGGASAPASLGALALQGAKTGLMQGAAYGFGSGEGGVGNRLASAAGGAALGAGAGAGGALIGRGVSKLADMGASKAGQAIGRVTGSAARLTPDERKGAAMVAQSMDNLGLTVDDAAKGVAQGRMLGQQSPAAADQLASYSRQLPGQARNQIIEGATDNLAMSRDALKTAMREGVDGEANSFKWLQDFKSTISKDARKGYAPFKTAQPAPDVVKWLDDNIDMEIWRGAKKIGGRDFVNVTKDKKGNLKLSRTPTLEEAEIFRRALADRTSEEFAAGRGNAGSALGSLENDFRSILDSAHGDLRAVRAKYADDKAIERAFDVGQKAFGGNAEEVEAIVSKMAAPERAAFSKGYWSSIRQRVDGKSIGSQADFKKVFETEDGARVLRLAVQKDAAPVRKAAEDWDEAAYLYKEVTGGSPTARRTGDDAMTRVSQAGDLAGAFTSGNPAAMLAATVSAAKGLFRQPPTDAQLQAAARIMMERNPDQFRRLMKGYFEGDRAARDRLRSIIQNVIAGAGTRTAGIGGGAELTGITGTRR